jgi:hypothetical protein
MMFICCDCQYQWTANFPKGEDYGPECPNCKSKVTTDYQRYKVVANIMILGIGVLYSGEYTTGSKNGRIARACIEAGIYTDFIFEIGVDDDV